MDQIVQALDIAFNPAQAALHQQALEYIDNFQQNANTTWRLALSLFVDVDQNGSRKYSDQVRFYALRVLDDFFANRFEPLDPEAFQTLQQTLVTYIQTEYVYGPAESSATFLRNKFSHTLTLFFLCTYMEQWPTFFQDLFTLIRPAQSSSQSTFNRHVSLLFFHLVLEISGEVADQLLKSARTFTDARQKRDTQVRDAVRERDAAQINEAVLTIVAESAERMTELRKNVPETSGELEDLIEIVDWGIRTFGSYVGWIDINLTVTPTTVPLLFTLLADLSLPIRLATSVALLRIVAKGLKEPGDKLQLIKVLSLGQVIDALETKTLQEQKERGSNTDEGEESYREALGKLLNVLGLELTKLDECPNQEIRSEASSLLTEIFPVMLRFMADEYDDTCSTIFPLLQTVLGSYKKNRKLSTEPIDSNKRAFIASLLKVILSKLRWDEEVDPEDMYDEDRAAFESLRKDLRTFVDSVWVIDQDLVTDVVRTHAIDTLTAYRNGLAVKWNDAELAVYLVYVFGEINKAGGKGRAAFCQAPAIERTERKSSDYSEYPLTTHGEMLMTLVQSGVASFPHKDVVMQFYETVARYSDFFKVRKECIMPTLQAMVGPRGIHNDDPTIRSRVFYLFHRFIKEGRNDVSLDLAVDLVSGIRDLLIIQVNIPEVEDSDQDLLTEAINNPGVFDSQLYLFETVGTLCSLLFRDSQRQTPLLLSVVKPLLDDLSLNLQASTSSTNGGAAGAGGDILPILNVHHIIMALGTVAKGFPEYPAMPSAEYIPPPVEIFGQIAQAILVCLEAMNVHKVVREAARFAFARILATLGPNVTHFIPPLMSNLLAHFDQSELVKFMDFIGLLIHKLQQDMFEVLDQLISPLSAHITAVLSQPVTGTDDQVTHTETKKAYLALLTNVMSSKLHKVFTSERNISGFEPLLQNMQQLAEDTSDPAGQKAALNFLGRCIPVWGQQLPAAGSDQTSDAVPGFERFIYERLVPIAFSVPSLPQFNPKDVQMLPVLHEIANMLQSIGKTRGSEAYEFILTVFLPSQNWPAQTAMDFVTKLRDLDGKNFRKYFTEFVRSSRYS